jgi:hypothetical protein
MTSQVELIKNRVNPFYISNDDIIDGEVDTYADLPASANLNNVYLVKTTTGIFGNRKLAGFYVYGVSGWVAMPVAMIASNIYYDSTASGLSANTVKGAIDELSASNPYVTSASFNTSDGVLTLTFNDASTVTVDLDGRFLQNVIEDTTPQLGGNLDLNSNDITGTGDISITGEVEATTLIGNMRGATIFKAKAGEALSKGDPVYISGDDLVGNQPVVSIADSDDANKMPCFGLANETVSANANVNVVTFGTITGLDTSSYSQGDILYISNTGTLTATKPSGESSLIQNIGKVMRSHASAGSIKVGGAGRTNDVPNLNDGNVFIGNASNQAETRGLTLDDIAETATKKHFAASYETKLNGIENNATADQTKADIDALNINADQVDGLEASQFLRSDTGDIINVGRGNVYIENNSDDNQNGTGITIRTSLNPGEGDEGSVGSIFAVRSSGQAARLWVGQSKTTTGLNNFVTNDATINGNITVTGSVDGRNVAEDGTKLDRTPFAIWAEENADLSSSLSSGFQWSFGNGNLTPVGTGIVLPFACNLIAISLSMEVTCTVEVEVYKNTSGTGKSVSITSAKSGYSDFESSPASYAAGDIINFRTLVGDTASEGGIVTAWLTRV